MEKCPLVLVLIQVIVFFWLFGLGIAFLTKSQKSYIQNSQKQISLLFKYQWKLMLGIAIGYLLSSVTISL